jgi:putative two-component system response regulator
MSALPELGILAPGVRMITSVLIVDDEPGVRNLMARWVSSLGLEARTANDADEALAMLQAQHYDVAVIDIMMPGHDGLWLANQLHRAHPHTAVVLASGYADLLEPPESTPIADVLLKPLDRSRFTLAVDRGRQWRQHALGELQWHAQLSAEFRDLTQGVCAEVIRRTANGSAGRSILIELANARVPHVIRHCERVSELARTIGTALDLDASAVDTIGQSALFHDIGKLAMPEALLTKPSPFTPSELAIMRHHVDAGATILASTNTLADCAPIVAATHEWFGGGGYPLKIAGEAIPFSARIIAVADAYDAMTENRHYRPRVESVAAIAEIVRCSPVQFDPTVVDAFVKVAGSL